MQEVLRQALVTADALLEDSRSDQPSLAQALKMASTDISGGNDNDFIERLRWFVYPKECADWIKEGRAVAPETESDDVIGALHPVRSMADTVGLSENGVALLTVSCEPSVGEIGVSETQKRKLHDASRESNIIATHTNEDFIPNGSLEKPDESIEKPEDSALCTFRDGEHQGEAPLDEIIAGHDGGELSDCCEIYDPRADAWVSIAKYTARTIKQNQVPIRVKGIEKVTSTAPVVPPEDLMTDAANQRKKPQRDSKAWGSTTSVPVDMKLAPSIAVTATAPSAPAPVLAPNASSTKKNKRVRHVKPPPKMMRYINQAVFQWNMLEEGDRLLLGLSGGKDSLSLLHCLLELQRKLPTNFEIEVCTIDPITPSFDPSPLIPYVESLGLKYHYIKDDIVARASTSGKDKNVVSSLCAFCARMKRGNLYTCARRNNCNKLVLAQHLDDCAESFLMSVMHNGFLRTMKANYQINAGDLHVIRPMVYCRESLMTDFAKASNLPVINENCPACFEEPKERARIKKLLAREETLFPNLQDNIRRSLIPLMHDDATAILRCYLEEALAKGKKDTGQKGEGKGGKGRKGKRGAVSVVSEEKKGDLDDAEAQDVKPATLPDMGHDQKRLKTSVAEASEEDLVRELARRKAEKFRLAGAMKRLEQDDGGPVDPTGQVCTLNGGDGSIPCRELME